MEKRRVNYKYIIVACLAIMLFSIALSIGAPMDVYADTISESYVLLDLTKDKNFNPLNYSLDLDDNSLDVIHIAESTENELLVYVYQPSGKHRDYRATSINISTELNSLSFKNYKLKYLNSSGVFFKYVVEDFVVSSASVRYYTISSIYRDWVRGVDDSASYDNDVMEVAYPVAKEFRYDGSDGEYSVELCDVVTVTDKFVGFVRYFDGYKLFGSTSCDSHFVAFNTDKQIDKLLEADVYYVTQSWREDWQPFFPTLTHAYTFKDDKEPHYVYLSDSDHVDHKGDGWGRVSTHEWNRIETVEEFVEENETFSNVYSGAVFNVSNGTYLTDEGKSALQNKKWVLRFAETPFYESTLSQTNHQESGTLVGEVTILRLKFETDGVTYNLGVVDNKQTGATDENGIPVPSGGDKTTVTTKTFSEFLQWLVDHTGIPKEVWIAIFILIPVIILVPVIAKLAMVFPAFGEFLLNVLKGFGMFFKVLWVVIKYIFKGLWWLICLPVKGIKALVEKIKERKG